MYLTLIFMAATIPANGGGARPPEWSETILQTLRELFSVLVDWLTPEKMLAGVILLAFYLYLRSQHQKQHDRVEATYYKPDLEPLPYEEEPPVEAAAAPMQTAPSATASSNNGLPDDPFYAEEVLERELAKKREDEYTKKMDEVTHQTRMNAVKSEELKVREKEANIRTKFGL